MTQLITPTTRDRHAALDAAIERRYAKANRAAILAALTALAQQTPERQHVELVRDVLAALLAGGVNIYLHTDCAIDWIRDCAEEEVES